MFFHSSSYTANPIACAAALANLEIWRDEPVMERIATLTARQAERLAALDGVRQQAPVRHHRRAARLAGDDGYLAGIGPALLGHLPRSRPAGPPDGQHRLCDAALLHRRGRSRPRLRRDRRGGGALRPITTRPPGYAGRTGITQGRSQSAATTWSLGAGLWQNHTTPTTTTAMTELTQNSSSEESR